MALSTGAPDVILAAGGILSRPSDQGEELLVVHRRRYDDWVLPKGKLRPGESVRAAALREVREETGCTASVNDYVGAIDYLADGAFKVVFFWRMSLVQQDQIQDHEEVAEVAWLSLADAVQRLTHSNEISILQRVFAGVYRSPSQWHSPVDSTLWHWLWPQRSDHARLHREFQSFRVELALLKARHIGADVSWAQAADDHLAAVERYLTTRTNVEGGWVCLHAARRCAVYGMNRAELASQASMLRAEAEKFSSWRSKEMTKQLDVNDAELTATRVVNAMDLRDEYSSNQYQKIWMLGDQLATLLIICTLGLILLIPLVALNTLYTGTATSPSGVMGEWSIPMVSAVLCFGLLGAGFSAALSLINTTGEGRIPERIANRYVTIARALFGGGVGLAGYALYRAKLFDVRVGGDSSGIAAALAIAFLFGFAGERLIAGVLGRATETKK